MESGPVQGSPGGPVVAGREIAPLGFSVVPFLILAGLGVLLLFSLTSWWLIFRKWAQFRRVRKQGDRFLEHMERAERLEGAYKSILSRPESPYSRVFRHGVNFFSELRPGALRQGAPPSQGLSLTQLEALRQQLKQ